MRLFSIAVLHLTVVLLMLWSSACRADSPIRVDDGLLVQLSHEQMEGVRQARVDRDSASDALAAAVLAKQEARDRLVLARKRREVVRAQIKVSTLQAKIGRERGSVQELAAAQKLQAYDGACLARVDQEIELYELQRAHADRSRGLAEERVKLCSAQVELEKARALRVLDVAAASGLTVQHADMSVKDHYQKVQDLQTRLQTVAAEVRGAARRHAELGRAADKLRP